MRRTLVLLLTSLLGATALTALTAPGAAADAFRYWGYYQWDGTEWQFATTGPGDTEPADGDVEGWRFAVTGEDAIKFPRADGNFAAICGTEPAAEGNKKVAVVIDYGAPEDNDGTSPPDAEGACAEVAAGAPGADVLAAVASTRFDESGLMCGINDYPATGCGDAVEGEVPETDESPVVLQVADTTEDESNAEGEDSGTSTLGIVVGVAAIAALAGALVVLLRRQRSIEE